MHSHVTDTNSASNLYSASNLCPVFNLFPKNDDNNNYGDDDNGNAVNMHFTVGRRNK